MYCVSIISLRAAPPWCLSVSSVGWEGLQPDPDDCAGAGACPAFNVFNAASPIRGNSSRNMPPRPSPARAAAATAH
ncbi:hypothetical protein G6F24_016610 [Rhizopus arrhizus]|nr:hypothetical protein G6F24_016610 [Rhizopus arrhizus]